MAESFQRAKPKYRIEWTSQRFHRAVILFLPAHHYFSQPVA
jgi:hypothetical protein